MGRPAVINRDALLDVVEHIVQTRGVGSLTIGEVAKAAGISKGGVQSCFGTKDQIINAMFERWGVEYDAQIRQIAGDSPAPEKELAAHVEVTRQMSDKEARRAAGMMGAMLTEDSQFRHALRDWYRSRMTLFDPATAEGRRARLAFVATEGAYILRCFGFLEIEQNEWEAIFEDIGQLIQTKTAS
jgi:AcrR family transcriptional regulator